VAFTERAADTNASEQHEEVFVRLLF